jgi:hypothetical protein
MRAAEAVRLGSLVVKPVAGKVSDGKGGGCAIGMGNFALGGAADCRQFEARYRWLDNTPQSDLPCDCVGDGLMESGCYTRNRDWVNSNYQSQMIHLFNYHVATVKDWTIDRLCEWLDSVDPTPREAQAAAPSQVSEAVEVTREC